MMYIIKEFQNGDTRIILPYAKYVRLFTSKSTSFVSIDHHDFLLFDCKNFYDNNLPVYSAERAAFGILNYIETFICSMLRSCA